MDIADHTKPFIFISHAAADADFANRIEDLLAELQIQAWNFNTQVAPGEAYIDKARTALESCTHIFVLIGPMTKDSQWVDMEMEVAMSANEASPGASLVGIILPHHDDFHRPYYEPELVPMRLHDFVRQDAALIKKWSENPEDLTSWINESRRFSRSIRRSRPSLSTLKFIRENAWSNEGDKEREGLASLSAHHIRLE
jgi:hypothetical protein